MSQLASGDIVATLRYSPGNAFMLVVSPSDNAAYLDAAVNGVFYGRKKLVQWP